MSDLDLSRLSDVAKAVAGSLFGMISPGKGDVTFGLRESRPSDETQAGLDELVRAGAVTVEAFNEFGGLVYRPVVRCDAAYQWLGRNLKNPAAKFSITAPLESEGAARAIQQAALAVEAPDGRA
jgi:hypothetical protein